MPFLSSLFNCSSVDKNSKSDGEITKINFELKTKMLHDRIDRLIDNVKILEKYITEVNDSIKSIGYKIDNKFDKLDHKFDMVVMKMEIRY